MFNRVSQWLDVVLETDIPNEVVAFGFNLYEDEHYNWSMELIGASEFDIDDEDWLCNEATDFNTRDNPLRWCKEAGQEEILHDIVYALKEYLKNGKYADVLKAKSGVGVGFVDGSIEILYAETKEKIRSLIEQKMSEWQDDNIYVISLYVFDEEDDPRRPVAVLGYNTERQVQKNIKKASDEQEARWNYAFWLQNKEMCLGLGDTAEDIREWIIEQDLWDREEEIMEKFVDLLTAVIQDIHALGLLKDEFRREIPMLIHELEYSEKIARQNIKANGETLVRDFVSFCMSYLPEVQNEMQAPQNEMSKAEKRITSSPSRSFVVGKESADMRKVIAFIIAIILVMSLFWVLGLIIGNRNKTNSEDTPQQTEDFEEETSMPSNQEKLESEQIKYQVYIQPDMPEPFIEVLRQYEEFMNADNQNLNDEDVQKKIYSVDGEWRYLYDESWLSALWRGEEGVIEEEGVIRYSLEDLTGDGYPELVMGYYISDDTILPEVVYYYSQTEGIKMECLSSYYIMVLYEDSVIEYISGGVNYTETFIQFQEETESWQQVACVVVNWDYETDSVKGYYWGDNLSGDLTDNRPMSIEEYQKIIAQYATGPMELEWTPLIFSAEPIATETEVITENDNETVSRSKVDAEKGSFFLRYIGDDDIEIFFKDCICEYDREGIRVYTCFLNDPMIETEGYAICIQTPERTETRFVKDYLIDKDAGCLYSLLVERRDGMDIFTRIQAEMVNGTANYVVAGTLDMEYLIVAVYGLEYLDDGKDFDCQQVEFTELYKENGKTILCGKVSALYNASDKKYSLEWEIDTETTDVSAKTSLDGF